MADAPRTVELSVNEAAKRLGLSERAVLYRIEQGKLKGRKRDQKWVVVWPEEDVKVMVDAPSKDAAATQVSPRRPDDRRGRAPQQDGKASDRRRYGDFRELAAYRKLGDILAVLVDPKHAKDESAAHLRPAINEAMERLAVGFYQWNPERKTMIYNEARDMIARVLHRLAIRPLADRELSAKIFEALHHDVMGIMVALFKAIDRKTGRAG